MQARITHAQPSKRGVAYGRICSMAPTPLATGKIATSPRSAMATMRVIGMDAPSDKQQTSKNAWGSGRVHRVRLPTTALTRAGARVVFLVLAARPELRTT